MCDHHKPCLLLQHNPSDYMRNQSEFGPKMLGIRAIFSSSLCSKIKHTEGSQRKKKNEIDGSLPSLLSFNIL
jgi:hypothetical protein